MYEVNKKDQLIVGLKRHLLIAQDTTKKKSERLQSLNNLSEVLGFIVDNPTEQLTEGDALLRKFFYHLLVKVKKACINIHTSPDTFEEELSFLSILQRL